MALLGLTDAGFSGDWSRIGVLTTFQEQQLQQLTVAIACVHITCSLGLALSGRGDRWLVLKALATGPLAVAEAVGGKEER